jgi:hypothetical protein
MTHLSKKVKKKPISPLPEEGASFPLFPFFSLCFRQTVAILFACFFVGGKVLFAVGWIRGGKAAIYRTIPAGPFGEFDASRSGESPVGGFHRRFRFGPAPSAPGPSPKARAECGRESECPGCTGGFRRSPPCDDPLSPGERVLGDAFPRRRDPRVWGISGDGGR